MTDILALPKLIPEADAYERFRDYLQDKELRRARTDRKLRFLRRRRKVMYREDDLLAFIGELVEQKTETWEIISQSYIFPCTRSRKAISYGYIEMGSK